MCQPSESIYFFKYPDATCQQAKPHHSSDAPTSCSWSVQGNSQSYLLVIIIIVLWDKNVMLLKQSSEVLANERPNIEKGDHNGEHAEKAEGHLQRGRAVAVSSGARQGRTAEGLAASGSLPPVDPRPVISNLILKSSGKFRARQIIRRDKVILQSSKWILERKV